MKWTRGTCEFLVTELKRWILSKNISLVEKLDIFFPVMNLPFAIIFFPFVIFASLFIPNIQNYSYPVNILGYGLEFIFATGSSKLIYDVFGGPDFFLINLLTFITHLMLHLEVSSRPLRWVPNKKCMYAVSVLVSCRRSNISYY
jgi:hypothetical protein